MFPNRVVLKHADPKSAIGGAVWVGGVAEIPLVGPRHSTYHNLGESLFGT